MDEEIKVLTQKAEAYGEDLERLQKEVEKVIVGQMDAVRRLILALIADGHVFLEGVPGLAKTLMVRTLSQAIESDFVRIQFTPDLLPADIIGTKIFEPKNGSFRTVKGPIFSNFVLADEINRAPAKVQSALLEAMQERQVSIQGETFPLPKPFFVLATQNPIESEGTYKLPEAQVDRFFFKLLIDYPSWEEEIEILNRFTENIKIDVKPVLTSSKIIEMQRFNKEIYADVKIKEYVASIVDATRFPEKYKIEKGKYIEYGASPRASLALILGGKALAMMKGRGFVKPEDIKGVAHDVLRHRIILTFEAEAEDVKVDEVVQNILERVKVP